MLRLDAGLRPIDRLTFSIEGQCLIAWSGGVPKVQWTLSNPTRAREIPNEGHSPWAVWSPDMNWVAEPCLDYDVALQVTGVHLRNVAGRTWEDEEHSFTKLTLTFSPDSGRLWGVGTRYHPQYFGSTILAW